jgi:uncharacterized protein
MSNPLLDRVLPQELAERRQVIEFKGKVDDFERLREIVEADLGSIDLANRPRTWRDAPVETRLEFAWLDPNRGRPAATGEVRASVTAVCQRCLEAFVMPIDISIRIVFADRAAADEALMESDAETWELDEDTVRPLDIVEESVIMALPLAPVHASSSECGPLAGSIAVSAPDKVRPFADLKTRMDESQAD